MSEKQDTKPMDLNDVLDKFNIFGRYHRSLLLFIMLGFASNNISCTNFIFTVPEVHYRCADADFENRNGCVGNASQYCTTWIYDNPNSFVAEYDLACHEWKRTLVGTAHSLGYMLGLLVLGPLSDKFGRKTTIIAGGVLGGVIGVARSFSPWYWLYVSLELLGAAIGDIVSPVYILMIELVPTKKRVVYSTLCSFGFTCGAFFTSLIASQEFYWRTHLRVIYSPALFLFTYYFLIDESPRWLLSKGRKEEAVKIIESAAKKNGIELDKNVIESMHYEDEKKVNFGYLLKSTFTSKTLALRFVVCVTWWIVCAFVNYGMTINSVSLPGNKYLNFVILTCLDIPGHIIVLLLLIKFNRKLPLMIIFTSGAVLCIAQSFIKNDVEWLSTTLYMLGKLSSSMNFGIIYLYTSELFPTYTRNSMHALCSSLGRIGSMVSTQTPLVNAYWPGLPPVLFGVASLLGAAATVLVPDTAHDSLPDTVRQAEQIGAKHRVQSHKNKNQKEEAHNPIK